MSILNFMKCRTLVFFFFCTAHAAVPDSIAADGSSADKRFDTSGVIMEEVQPSVSNGETPPETPPVLRELSWIPGDTTVELSITFNRIPSRYLAYSLKESDRIVLDCFETELATTIGQDNLPGIIIAGLLKKMIVEPDISLTRLVLFIAQPLPFHVIEEPGRLRLVLASPPAGAQPEETAGNKRRQRVIFVSAGAAAFAAGALLGTLIGRSSSDDDTRNKKSDIPSIDIPTPDGE